MPLFKSDPNNPQSDPMDEKFAAIIALGLAFFVARFISQTPQYQQFFVEYLGFVAVMTIAFIGLLVLLTFAGFRLDGGGVNDWIIIVLGLTLVAGFFVTGGADMITPDTDIDGLDTVFQLVEFTLDSGLIWVIIVLIIIVATMGGGGGGGNVTGNWLPPAPYNNNQQGGNP